jgi:hypothetical protein
MVTKQEIENFSGLNAFYPEAQAEAIVFECVKFRKSETGELDLGYIREKAASIVRWVRDVSFDIEKCRAGSIEELIAVFKCYLDKTDEQAKEAIVRGAWVIRVCRECFLSYSLPIRLEYTPYPTFAPYETAWHDCCPWCYKPIGERNE